MTLTAFPDAENAVRDLLADLVQVAYAGARTLAVIQSGKLPVLRVMQLPGGTSDRVTTRCLVSVAVFAPDADTAKAVAGQVQERLVRGPLLSDASFRTAHGRIDKATVEQVPELVTSPDVALPQCSTAIYQVSMRR